MIRAWKGKCHECGDETGRFDTRTDAKVEIAGGEDWSSCRNGCDREPVTVPLHSTENPGK